MAVHRKIKKIGGSLTVVIPRDLAEAMSIGDGDGVRLSLVGRQLVVEPADDTADEASFRRAFAIVLRRYDQTFQALADFDRGAR